MVAQIDEILIVFIDKFMSLPVEKDSEEKKQLISYYVLNYHRMLLLPYIQAK